MRTGLARAIVLQRAMFARRFRKAIFWNIRSDKMRNRRIGWGWLELGLMLGLWKRMKIFLSLKHHVHPTPSISHRKWTLVYSTPAANNIAFSIFSDCFVFLFASLHFTSRHVPRSRFPLIFVSWLFARTFPTALFSAFQLDWRFLWNWLFMSMRLGVSVNCVRHKDVPGKSDEKFTSHTLYNNFNLISRVCA